MIILIMKTRTQVYITIMLHNLILYVLFAVAAKSEDDGTGTQFSEAETENDKDGKFMQICNVFYLLFFN